MARRREGPPWSSDTSRRCSRSPRRGRSPPRPTRWRPCSRTCPTRCASSRPSSACRCSCAAGGAPSPPSSVCSCSTARAACERELEAMRADLALLQGLDAGYARLGVVGTASRWLVPALVADLRERAPGRAAARERGCVGAALRRGGRRRARAGRRHRAGQRSPARGRAPARRGRSSVSSATTSTCRASRCRSRRSRELPLVLPPEPNPLRIEVDRAAEAAGITLDVPVEVEGIRLIADLVVAGDYASILPETAIPPELEQRAHGHDRRAAAAPARDGRARDVQLSLADQAVRDSVRSARREAHAVAREPGRSRKQVRSRTKQGVRSMAARTGRTTTAARSTSS